jgi:hypothetical protein
MRWLMALSLGCRTKEEEYILEKNTLFFFAPSEFKE